MPKAKSAPEPNIDVVDKPLPSADEFRAAVKYALTHDHGMPALYADEVLDTEAQFVESHRQRANTVAHAITNAADGLRFEPPKGLKWVPLTKDQRIAEKNQLVLDADGALGKYLDCLVTLGLHGPDRDAVAGSMLAKGIESVFPLITMHMNRKTA